MIGYITNLKDLGKSFETFKNKIMLQASEATKLTKAFKQDISAIEERIKAMAEAGNSYAVIEVKRLKDPQEYATRLRDAGYTVVIDKNYFSVSWPDQETTNQDDLKDVL
jgi:hypothetical protein